MSSEDIISLLPLLVVMSTAAIVMLSIAWHRSQLVVVTLSILGLGVAMICTASAPDFASFAQLLIFDSYAKILSQLLLLSTIVIFVFTYEYSKNKPEFFEEFYLLLLLSLTGALVMVASNHFVSFFLGLELLTIPLYCAIGYYTRNPSSLEAAVKYIILAGLASGLLLFGTALIYASLGTMNFELVAQALVMQKLPVSFMFLCGFALIIAAIGFKISAVPFHLWTPDVYDGAPLPAMSFLATVSKAASLTLFLRLWILMRAQVGSHAFWLIMAMAILSMLAGNLLALRQENIKRLLAYSSIAQFGYITMALLATGNMAMQAVLLYLVAYVLTALIIFGVLMNLGGPAQKISDLEGLFARKPGLALMFSFGLLSLMGMPLTALFMAKFLVIMAGMQSAQWPLIISLVASSGIGVFVYVRVINILFKKPSTTWIETRSLSPLVFSTLAILTLSVLFLGLWPTVITANMYGDNTHTLLNN